MIYINIYFNIYVYEYLHFTNQLYHLIVNQIFFFLIVGNTNLYKLKVVELILYYMTI